MAKKGASDMTTILYQFLIGSSLKSAISGDLHKGKRPGKSLLEDVVINAITLDGEQIQSGVANVNIYVPDIEVPINGRKEGMPNLARLNVLKDIAIGLLERRTITGYRFDFDQSSDAIEEPDANAHYINLRVAFRFYPT